SHMGVIEVTGRGARAFLDRLATCCVRDLPAGRARYGLMLNPAGGVLDDVLVYALADERLWVVANAANAARDLRWMAEHAGLDVSCTSHFGEVAILALQGPRALAIAAVALRREFNALRRFHFGTWREGEGEVLASRTGYTGEDGLEFFCPASMAEALWERLLRAGKNEGLLPCGLGARDVLRIEAGNVLYGHEIDEETTPVDANLMWAVHLDKGDFIGREALLAAQAAGPRRLRCGLVVEERAIPREGAPVGAGEQACGVVTSGTFSPTLQKGIAMAYLAPSHAEAGRPVWVELRGKRRAARIVSLPFYRRH
ncbi:MAG: glycine cleavage system aminomethyltransferase GcvT, partial [Armatimonadota bacterium]|nr:glycine cleavage system aminomethyltransferase GcvT [Armatimonadota bacterium]